MKIFDFSPTFAFNPASSGIASMNMPWNSLNQPFNFFGTSQSQDVNQSQGTLKWLSDAIDQAKKPPKDPAAALVPPQTELLSPGLKKLLAEMTGQPGAPAKEPAPAPAPNPVVSQEGMVPSYIMKLLADLTGQKTPMNLDPAKTTPPAVTSATAQTPAPVAQPAGSPDPITEILSRRNIMEPFKAGNTTMFNNTLGQVLGSGFGGDLLSNVVGGGDTGISALDHSLDSTFGSGFKMSKGIYEGLLAGGMPTGLDPNSSMGKILGDSFKNVGKEGFFNTSMTGIKDVSGAGTFQSSLLSSSAGKAEILGGTGSVLQKFFASLHPKP
ncbi:MAG TPA: hypothetical protein V6C52_07550 [Coleofasciculaceae cyanobacterium]